MYCCLPDAGKEFSSKTFYMLKKNQYNKKGIDLSKYKYSKLGFE